VMSVVSMEGVLCSPNKTHFGKKMYIRISEGIDGCQGRTTTEPD
jgi:hypothetical protein